jgi:hypothetical protein
MTFRSVGELDQVLWAPPYELPKLHALPELREHVTPGGIGEPEVDAALDEYRAAFARARELQGKLSALMREHDETRRRFRVAWRDHVTTQVGAKPTPERIAELAEEVPRARNALEVAILDVARRWDAALEAVAVVRSDGDLVGGARDAFVAGVALVGTLHHAYARAEALARWLEDPDLGAFRYSANPTVLTPDECDRYGIALDRVLEALVELVEDRG